MKLPKYELMVEQSVRDGLERLGVKSEAAMPECAMALQDALLDKHPAAVACDACGGARVPGDPQCWFCAKIDKKYELMKKELIVARLKELGKKVPKVLADAAVALERALVGDRHDVWICERCGGATDKEEPCSYCGNGAAAPEPEPEKLVRTNSAKVTQIAEARRKRQPKGAASLSVVESQSTAAEGNAALATQPVTEAAPVELTAAELAKLEAAVAKVNDLAKGATLGTWETANELNMLYSSEAWKRALDDGGAMFLTWKAFCKAKLSIAYEYTFELMRFAQVFTREEFEQIGMSRARVAVKWTPEERAKLLADQPQRPKRGRPVGSVSSAVAEESAVGSEPRASGGAVSVMVRVNEVTVLPKVVANGYHADGKPALALGDNPEAVEEHDNGVKSVYTLRSGQDGQIELVIKRTRA